MFFKDRSKKLQMVNEKEALPGRQDVMKFNENHFVNGSLMKGPFPEDSSELYLGMGCFWGAERLFWNLEGVYVTSVGYAGGFTPNPLYEEVCSGLTGHTEVVHVVFDSKIISPQEILKVFWEGHDPTQGMRQGNDSGTQYRSAIYYSDEKFLEQIKKSEADYSEALKKEGYSEITTEILPLKDYFYAEDYHQQYLAKNPNGYCGIGGCGVKLPE